MNERQPAHCNAWNSNTTFWYNISFHLQKNTCRGSFGFSYAPNGTNAVDGWSSLIHPANMHHVLEPTIMCVFPTTCTGSIRELLGFGDEDDDPQGHAGTRCGLGDRSTLGSTLFALWFGPVVLTCILRAVYMPRALYRCFLRYLTGKKVSTIRVGCAGWSDPCACRVPCSDVSQDIVQVRKIYPCAVSSVGIFSGSVEAMPQR